MTRVFITIGLLLALISFPMAQLNQTMAIGSNVTSAPPNNNPLDPTVLSDLAPYACLRFMDWEGTVPAGWGPYTSNEQNVDLCNTLKCDGWFCVYHTASDADVRSMAQMLKSKMDPSLKIYIEYSNETWNTASFWLPMVLHCESLAKNAGIVPAAITDQVLVAGYGHVYRATQIWAIFEDVFGNEMAQRVIKVIAGHSANGNLTNTHLNALKDPKVNPGGLLMDAYAIAPYFGAETDGGNMTNAMTLAKAVRVGSHLKYIIDSYNKIVGADAKLIAYEGGQHFATSQSAFSDNPGAYDVYKAYLDMLAPFMDLFCHYTHTHPFWGSSQAFGAKSSWGQSVSQSHKYRALVDWANEHPYVPSVTAARQPETKRISCITPGNSSAPETFDMTGKRVGGTRSMAVQIIVTRRGQTVPAVRIVSQ